MVSACDSVINWEICPCCWQVCIYFHFRRTPFQKTGGFFLKLIMLLMFTFIGRTEENTCHFLAVSLYKNSHHCAVNKAALPCPSHSEVEALFVSPKRKCSKGFCYMQSGIIIKVLSHVDEITSITFLHTCLAFSSHILKAGTWTLISVIRRLRHRFYYGAVCRSTPILTDKTCQNPSCGRSHTFNIWRAKLLRKPIVWMAISETGGGGFQTARLAHTEQLPQQFIISPPTWSLHGDGSWTEDKANFASIPRSPAERCDFSRPQAALSCLRLAFINESLAVERGWVARAVARDSKNGCSCKEGLDMKESSARLKWKQAILRKFLLLRRWRTCTNVGAFAWMTPFKHCQS